MSKYTSLFLGFAIGDKLYLSKSMKYFFATPDQEFETLENMDKFGGSFVKQLSELYRRGDGINKLKLVNCFEEYFTTYRDWSKENETKS